VTDPISAELELIHDTSTAAGARKASVNAERPVVAKSLLLKCQE
jgi:hypothetical protein